jgi:phosphate transport system protein
MTEKKWKAYANADSAINIVKKDALILASEVMHQFELVIANFDSDDTQIMREEHNLSDKMSTLHTSINQTSISHLTNRKSHPLELKLMLTTLQITNDLRHINDQTETIARRAETFIKPVSTHQSLGKPHIAHCARLTLEMMDKAMNAFSLLDANLAREGIHLCAQVTEEYNFIACKLMDRMLKDPRSISSALNILYIAKAIENVASHAKNISQHVVDIVKELESDNMVEATSITEGS